MYSLYVIKVIEMIVTPLKLAVVTISISNVYHMRLGGAAHLQAWRLRLRVWRLRRLRRLRREGVR